MKKWRAKIRKPAPPPEAKWQAMVRELRVEPESILAKLIEFTYQQGTTGHGEEFKALVQTAIAVGVADRDLIQGSLHCATRWLKFVGTPRWHCTKPISNPNFRRCSCAVLRHVMNAMRVERRSPRMATFLAP